MYDVRGRRWFSLERVSPNDDLHFQHVVCNGYDKNTSLLDQPDHHPIHLLVIVPCLLTAQWISHAHALQTDDDIKCASALQKHTKPMAGSLAVLALGRFEGVHTLSLPL